MCNACWRQLAGLLLAVSHVVLVVHDDPYTADTLHLLRLAGIRVTPIIRVTPHPHPSHPH